MQHEFARQMSLTLQEGALGKGRDINTYPLKHISKGERFKLQNEISWNIFETSFSPNQKLHMCVASENVTNHSPHVNEHLTNRASGTKLRSTLGV